METNLAVSELAADWQKSGIEGGDTVLIHSNIKRTLVRMRKKGAKILPVNILESFLEALGPEGTLVLPLFNFDFTTSKLFDLVSTPSHMGALTEVGRKHNGAIRTGHPIYSFAVIGKNASAFEGVDNKSGYGHDSPFAILRSLNGKIGSLDLEDQNSMTFYHHVEEICRVPYRYFKEFRGTYRDRDGLEKIKTYKLFVRDIEKGVLTHVNPAGEELWEKGLYKGDRPLVDSGLRTINANAMFSYVKSIIEENRAEGTLYKVENTE